MSEFTAILSNTVVASSNNSVIINNGFQNINGIEFLAKLKTVPIGDKDGSHFLRSTLITDDRGKSLPRSNANTASHASVLILDCDKRIDSNGEVLEGSPDPYKISEILRAHNIAHVLYGSHSHYVGNKGHRFRIILITRNLYNKAQLDPTVESIISLINSGLDGDLLASATENNCWAQPWYYPRKPANSSVDSLYFEYVEGQAIEVVDPLELPPMNKGVRKIVLSKVGEISVIGAFNEQYKITDLLVQYGYKRIYAAKEYERWLSPDSTSGKSGITVKNNKFFSHHGSCPFNDGYWHDAFDLMRVSEGLSECEAIKKAAQNTLASGGLTVDQYNKGLVSKHRQNKKSVPSQSIPHTEILKQLNTKIMAVNFRETAGIVENEKLRQCHFQIIVIEKILDLAKFHNWGICRNHDFVYLYNGEYWSFIDEDELKVFLGGAAEKMSVDKFYARYFNFREQLYKQFIALAHLPKPEQPKDVVFINLKNGTFEITPAGTRLKPFNSEDFITYQLPFEYNPSASTPLFEACLAKVLPDKQLQNILSEYLGYLFIHPSILKLEKVLLLYGTGANGKSVFYEIIRSLLGDQNISQYSLESLTDDTGYYRAMLANKLLNYASEINGKLKTSIFKQMASGEPIEARLPYGKPFVITQYAKLIFNCNELPKDVEQTEAYFRRFLIVPFEVTIPEAEQDKQLAKKIIDAELSGVFNWVLAGLKRLLEQKRFTDCDVVRQMRVQYEKESDSVRLFIDEMGYVASATGYITIKMLYFEYKNFCLEDGFKSVNKTNFKKRLEKCKITIERRNVGQVVFVTRA